MLAELEELELLELEKEKSLFEVADEKDAFSDSNLEDSELIEEFKDFIRQEVSKITPVQNVIEKVIETKVIEPKAFHVEPRIVEAPPQIIKEVTHEVRVEVPKKDERKFVELSVFQDLLVKFGKVQNQLKEVQRMAESPIVLGGSGVIGIPPPEPKPAGYVLTVNSEKKAEWKAATGGSDPETDSVIYFGTRTANGSWRIIVSGSDLSFQRLESSTWVEKGATTA